VGDCLSKPVGGTLMTYWHLRVRGLWFLALELAVGAASIATVAAIAKYGL